jgi:integrase
MSRSTRLTATQANERKATLFAKKLQLELDRKRFEFQGIGICKISIGEAFEHFLQNNKHKHPDTIRDYRRFYKLFTKTFNEDEVCTNITKLNVEKWLINIKELPLSQNSIHGYGKQCNHFLNFLFEYNYTAMFKINRAVKTRPEIKEKVVFKEEHISFIFENLEEKNSNFKTAIQLLFYTGLRSSDILTLTVENIDVHECIMSYYSPKRKKHRTVPFHKCLVPVLSSRISEIKSGRLLEYNSVENLGRAITRYFERIGIGGHSYTARTFRKTFITLCRNKFEMDATIVKELVGHEHGNTTDRYYNQVSLETIRKELTKFEYPIKKQIYRAYVV